MALQKDLNVDITYYNNQSNISILFKIDNSVSNQVTKTITIPSAYIKIINLQGDKNKIVLSIGIFDKKDGNFITSDTFEFIPDISSASKNFIQQGYEQLKINKYQGATDLLDEGQVA